MVERRFFCEGCGGSFAREELVLVVYFSSSLGEVFQESRLLCNRCLLYLVGARSEGSIEE